MGGSAKVVFSERSIRPFSFVLTLLLLHLLVILILVRLSVESEVGDEEGVVNDAIISQKTHRDRDRRRG